MQPCLAEQAVPAVPAVSSSRRNLVGPVKRFFRAPELAVIGRPKQSCHRRRRAGMLEVTSRVDGTCCNNNKTHLLPITSPPTSKSPSLGDNTPCGAHTSASVSATHNGVARHGALLTSAAVSCTRVSTLDTNNADLPQNPHVDYYTHLPSAPPLPD